MPLQLVIPHMFVENLIKAFFLGLWVIGSFMLILLLLSMSTIRLQRRRRFGTLDRKKMDLVQMFRELPFVKKFVYEIEFAELKISVEFILSLMLFFGLFGYFSSETGIYLLRESYAVDMDRAASTQSWIISGFLAFLFFTLPYFYVHFRVQRKRHQIAFKMITVVQNLIGHYRRYATVAEMVSQSASTMPEEVEYEWKRLELMVTMKPIEDALYEFAKRIENVWADDLADLLFMHSRYGVDISENLKKLVADIQTAKRNEDKRLTMLTSFRIGTVVMFVLAFFIIAWSIHLDRANYRYYFIDPGGRVLIISTFAVFFISMILVVRSGKKQF